MTSTLLQAGAAAIVTGAGSGIGKTAAQALAAAGAAVMVNATDPEAGQAVVDLIEESGGRANLHDADVRVEDEVRRLVADTVQHFGPLRIAVNNGGIASAPTPLTKLASEDWHDVIATNLTGVFFCLKHEVAAMREHTLGGSIINVTSTSALPGAVGMAASSTSKHGVIGLTRSAAREVARHQIRVNAVCRGFVLAPSAQQVLSAEPGQATICRPGGAVNVADAITWLASPHSTFITGVSVPVDGGVLAH